MASKAPESPALLLSSTSSDIELVDEPTKQAQDGSFDDDERQKKKGCCSYFQTDSPEENPWQATSYILSVFQFLFITTDLFVDTQINLAMHYVITTVEFVVSLYLTAYQILRLLYLFKWMKNNQHPSGCCDKATLFLIFSAMAQAAIVGCSAFSYVENNDTAEWTIFGAAICWGMVNPLTFGAVEEFKTKSDTSSKNKMGPFQAMYSVFRYHFTKFPLQTFLGFVFAAASAILTTYQGSIINALTKAATRSTDEKTVLDLSRKLLGFWAAAIVSKFIFGLISASMFTKLEIWLRRTIFEKGYNAAKSEKDADTASYQTNYASDITGVVSLYSALLKEFLVNILMVITAFIYLALEEWKIATVTLGFLAMAFTNGPTGLAGDRAAETQRHVTSGVSLLSKCNNTNTSTNMEGGPPQEQPDYLQQHEDQVLSKLTDSLFWRTFYTGSVGTFIDFYTSFLTAIVVISMSWEVYEGRMEATEFLGTFFVYKQLQKPATKMSGITKKLVKSTASLERINNVVLKTEKTD